MTAGAEQFVYMRPQDGEQKQKLCALLLVLQKCLKEEYNHNLVDIETLNAWLTNLVPCPQSLMIDTKLQQIQVVSRSLTAQARWCGLSRWLVEFGPAL